MRNFSDLTEREVLALAIANEEEDSRIYTDIAEGLRQDYPASANVFTEMAGEESEHRRRLIELYQEKFGEHIPLIRRHDVRGFIQHKPIWQIQPLSLDQVRDIAETMETETKRFYRRAAARTTDASIRKLLGDLAEAEAVHEQRADEIVEENLPAGVRAGEDANERRIFVLRVIQPGLAGLMDGSVSTLAPVFAAAFATGQSWNAFLVGIAASIGAGISMAFAEALSDNGSLTGRGAPVIRGAITGVDDHSGRHRSYAALSHTKFLDRDVAGDLCRGRGAGGDQLGALEVHGHAAYFRRIPGGIWRRPGVRRGHFDRQQLGI